MRPRHLFASLAIGLAVAAQARAQTPGDPFEKWNRRSYDNAMVWDKKLFLPISRLYQAATPGVLGLAIHNMVTNLSEPVVICNDFLQLRVKRGADDLARLVTNTTFGIGGMIDLAKRQGLPHRDNDFGVTLGRWGVKPGAYLFLPLLGPSTVRDAIGTGVDSLMNPLTWASFPGHFALQWSTTLAGAFDSRIRAQAKLDAETSGATDPYATIRSDFLQSREAMIRGEEAAPVLTPLDEPSEPSAPSAPPAGGSSPEGGQSPSAATSPTSAAFAAADAAATARAAPSDAAPQVSAAPSDQAAADDPDLAMVTAEPCDRDQTASATRLAGL